MRFLGYIIICLLLGGAGGGPDTLQHLARAGQVASDTVANMEHESFNKARQWLLRAENLLARGRFAIP